MSMITFNIKVIISFSLFIIIMCIMDNESAGDDKIVNMLTILTYSDFHHSARRDEQ